MQTGAIYTSILSHHSEVYTIVNGLEHRGSTQFYIFIKYLVCMWFLSDFYISTDFGQPVRSSEAHRVRGLPHRHDACYAVFSSLFTQDGGKHNIIPKKGLQVVVADPYDEWDLEERLHRYQVNSGVDKLPPTQSHWLEHICRAHVQASVWSQDKPNLPTSRLDGRCNMTN